MGDLSRDEEWKMFVLGAVEVFPMLGLPVVGPMLTDAVPVSGWIAVGVGLMIALCWSLRNQTPQLPIHVAGGRANTPDGETGKAEARETDTKMFDTD